MVRSISSAIEAEKDSVANIPTELYQIFLPDNTLYLAVWPHSLDFYNEDGGTQTYSAAAISRQAVKKTKDLSVDRLKVSIDNVNQEWSAYAANYDLSNVKVTIWKVFLERTSDGSGGYEYSIIGDFNDKVEMFSGYIDNPQIDESKIVVTLKSPLDTLDERLPRRKFTVRCPWRFGSEECGKTPPTQSGSISSLSSDHTVVTLDTLSDTNWNHGTIKVGEYSRQIINYDLSANTITLEFGLPADVSSGDSYTLTAGCSKVRDDSSEGCEYWANKENYGGFPAIPEIRNIRED